METGATSADLISNIDTNAVQMMQYDPSVLMKHAKIPPAFTWPAHERPAAADDLGILVVDLSLLLGGHEAAHRRAVDLVRAACREHGFFQVTNHGVDAELCAAAIDAVSGIFELPFGRKLSARQKMGSMQGYAVAHSDRFSTKLPWKETFTFMHSYNGAGPGGAVETYFKSALGPDFHQIGKVFEKYCEEMEGLSLVIAELLGVSLRGEGRRYREFFQDGSAIVRCNYYPPCVQADLTLGTGPHADPNAFTILQQDADVCGLDVFTGGRWRTVRPVNGALVINVGDTFEALSNGEYKSCLHRAVVNPHKERRSIAYFVCPRNDKVVRPPPELIASEGGSRRRKYPDFTWLQLQEFTQSRHRVDEKTLRCFADWLRSSPLAN